MTGAAEFLKEDYLTEDEVCAILKIKPSTLASRRCNGTEHPPYVEIGKVRLYPKAMFREWIAKRKVIWEVRSAS
jgi:hypothetical protein